MTTDLGLPIGKCEEAARRRKAKRLVRKFEEACRMLQACGPWDTGIPACKAEYKRTRNNLLEFMGV